MESKKIFYFMTSFALLSLIFAVDLSNCSPIPGNSTSSISKRQKSYSGDMTFYHVGLGACGKYNNDNQYVAAISHSLFDSIPSPGGNPNKNKFCGRKAKICRGSKSVVVTIVDRCGGCDNLGNIDVSPQAFKKLAKPAEGRVKVKWTLL